MSRFSKFILPTVLVALMVSVTALPYAEAHSGVSLSGYATTAPTIDADIGSTEWAAAATATFGPFPAGGETISGTLYMMNDRVNLYVAVIINGDNDYTQVPFDSVVVRFDNDHGAEASHEEGDDSLSASWASTFVDAVRSGLWFADDSIGGTSDGSAGGQRHVDGSNQWEISHPLDSNDNAYDFSLSAGQTVGFCLMVAVDGAWYSLSAYSLGREGDPSTYANYVVAPLGRPVGGVLVPVNKLSILAPYLAFIGLFGAVTVAVAAQRRRKN